ncbi:MAG: glycine betaine ABC transporter substrate-binding protein [Tissierella sp.]|uniref:glycine betaine ABC transporter substrate-binding protein n=1 Tax=Tissierella sp. TaxID=41274 RepID=UPI003F99DDEE
MFNYKKGISLSVVLVLLVGILAGCGGNDDSKEIVLLEGQFAEIDIIMHALGDVLEEKTDLKVKYHDSMNTVAAGDAMERDEVDIYVSYDGTLLTTILGHDPSDVPEGEELFEFTKEKGSEEKGLTLLEKFGFENTYALAVKDEFGEENNIQTISDLKPYTEDLIFGAEHEFFDEEGTMRFKPFNKHYDIEWQDSKSLDIGLKYAAIDNENIDVTMVYSTDGLNKKSELKVLEDDLAFFPEYYAAFLMRDTLFEEYEEEAPQLEEILKAFTGTLDNEKMAAMNYDVDSGDKTVQEVVDEFLEEEGLLEKEY